MADNKDYNFDNFDDTKIYGRHFKEEEPQKRVFSDEFDIDETRPFDINMYNEADESTDDYGDDFYSDGSNFENEEDDEDITAVKPAAAKYEDRAPRSKKSNKTDKKKNAAIIALSITLAVVIFVFSLIFFLSNSNEGDKKETRKPTVSASETVVVTETQEQTQEETDPVTQAPTQELTQAQTEPQTQAETEAPVIEPETEYIPEDPTDFIEDTVE